MSLDKLKTGSGLRFRTEAMIPIALPVPYAANFFRGSIVLGEDGRLKAAVADAFSPDYHWQTVLTPNVDGQVLVNLDQAATASSFVLGATDLEGVGRVGRLVTIPSPALEPGATIAPTGVAIGRVEFGSRSLITTQSNSGRPARIQANAMVGWAENSKPADLVFFAASQNTDPFILDPPPTIRYRITHDGAHDFSGASNNLHLRINATGNVLIGNTTGTEKLSVTGNIQTTGNFRVGTNQVVGTRIAGWTAATGSAVRNTFATNTVTTAALAQRVKALIDDLIEHGLIGT